MIKQVSLQNIKFLSHFRKDYLIAAIFFLGILNSAQPVQAQESTTKPDQSFRSNTIHGGLGLGVSLTATLNYERLLTQNLDRFVTATYIRTGIGAYATWGDPGQYLFVQYGILTGRNAAHFELSAGPNFTLKEGEFNSPIAGSIGVRRQKPGKPFMIRFALSYPEMLHFGMGLSF